MINPKKDGIGKESGKQGKDAKEGEGDSCYDGRGTMFVSLDK